MRKLLAFIALLLAAPPVLYAAFIVSTVLDRGYHWGVMDWNSDGRTELHEVITATDVIPHETVQNGQRCTSYFHYRKATMLRTDCKLAV